MPLQRSVLITGANGYVGRITLAELSQDRNGVGTVVAYDIRMPSKEEQLPDVTYRNGDIRTDNLSALLEEHRITAVVHLISIVTPQKGEGRAFARAVDVDGTRRLLDACVQNRVHQFIVTSSGAAYGYHPDSPEWLVETDPLRGNEEFAYSDHKRLVEEMLARFRTDHPGMRQLVLRPGTILGKTTDNQITDMFKKRTVTGVCGSDSPFVFIWDVDMARIIVRGLHQNASGIYNVAGDGAMTLRQIAKELNRGYMAFPAWALKAMLWTAARFGSPYGPEQVNFLRYRPVLSNRKLKEEFGYIPTFTSEQTFRFFMEENLRIIYSQTQKN